MTSSSSRPVPSATSLGVTSAAVLDGDLGEWSDFAAAALDRDTATTIRGAPPERADLSGTLRWAWDAAELYLALHVTDDALVHDSADLAQDDVFELAIDGNGDTAGGGPGDHLYRITQDGRQSDHGVATQALTVAARTVAGGWDLEIVIPAGQFAPGGLAPGRPIHFNWALGDDDNGGAGDARLIAYGTRLDPPETAWRWATLSAGVRDFVGLFDPGRWEAVTPLPAASAPWYWDPLTGWRGDGAAMLRTTDGGATWQTAVTGLPAVDAFQFVDARNGWAWHNGSHSLAHTADGGATWQAQSTGTATLSGLQFVDSLTGWVRGDGGELRQTVNGGLNWQQVAPDQIGAGFQFVDRRHGWTFGEERYSAPPFSGGWTWQARSTDGGNTWSRSGGAPFWDNVVPGYAVFYFDANLGWGVRKWWDGRDDRDRSSWEYTLQHTTDGGVTWTDLWGAKGKGRGPTDLVTGIYAADPERVWAWGSAPVPGWLMGVSTDGGSTWKGQRTVVAVPQNVRFDRTGLAYAFSDSTLRYRNTEISAYHAYRPPQIDGNLADWAGVPAYVLNAERAYRVLWATPTPLDASATLQAAWDNAHLYFAVRVYDDAVRVDSGAQPWQDDAVEIGLDGRHDHVRNWALDDDRQFTVTALGQIYESGKLLTDVPVARADHLERLHPGVRHPQGPARRARPGGRRAARPQLDLDR